MSVTAKSQRWLSWNFAQRRIRHNTYYHYGPLWEGFLEGAYRLFFFHMHQAGERVTDFDVLIPSTQFKILVETS